MRPEGIAEVERAKADRRWDRAYESPANAVAPPDLAAAVDAVPAVARSFGGLASSRRFAIIRQVEEAKRAEIRERRIAKAVEMLANLSR